MSQKGKTKICFLVLLCAVGLSEAFNSVKRSPKGEESAQVQHIEPDAPAEGSPKSDVKQPQTNPVHPVVPHHKGVRRVRRAKQRHSRNSQDWQTETEMGRIFSAPGYQNQQTPVTNSRSDVYPQYGYNPYGYVQPQLPQQPAGYPYFPPSSVAHNTIVPNGPQINNYYHQVLPPQRQPQLPPQQYLPTDNYNNYPAPYISGQFLFIPVPFYYPCLQPQVPPPNPNPPPSNTDDIDPTLNVTIPMRAGFGEDQVQVNPSDYYNTPTGISLQPVKPLRPNSIQPPPAEHKYDDNDDELDDNFGNSVSQSRPTNRPTPRPPPRTTTRPRPASPSQGSDVPDASNNRPSSCVWAIVQCCPNNSRLRDLMNCFERLRCPGAFFDANPCLSEFGKAVSSAAAEYQRDGLVLA